MALLKQALPGLFWLWGASLGLQLLLHVLVVGRRLHRQGQRFPTGFLLPWRVFSELFIYREWLRAEARPLGSYHFYMILLWFNVLLGATLGLFTLAQHTGRGLGEFP